MIWADGGVARELEELNIEASIIDVLNTTVAFSLPIEN